MLAVVLALCASLSVGTGDFLAGSQARRTSLWAVIVVSQITGLVWTGALVAARGHGLPMGELWAATGAGVTAAAGIALGYKALTIGIMGIVGPIISLSVAVPLAVGLARGERPSAYQLGGIVIALAGVVLAARQKSAGRRHQAASRLSVVLALATAAIVGVNMLFYASAAKHDPYWGIFIARATSAAIFAAAFAIMRPRTRLTRAAIIPLIAVGVLDTGANGLFSVASTYGYLSVVSVLSSVFPIFTVILAYVFLNERLSRTQQFGVAAALVGVGFIAAG
jgi:drug/metabolite transporter (DMT)-like permease